MDWWVELRSFVVDLPVYVWSVVNNWAGYVTGGLIVALVALRALLLEPWKPSRRFSLALVSLFLFLALFKSWREEHHKVLEQATLMEIDPEKGPPTPDPFHAGGNPPAISIGVSNGDKLAEDEWHAFHLELYDLPAPYLPGKGNPSPSSKLIEDEVWKRFMTYAGRLQRGKTTWNPHKAAFSLAELDRALTASEVEDLRNGRKLLYIVGFAEWSDGEGRHEFRHCSFVRPQQPPSDGTSAPFYIQYCYSHNNLEEAVD